MMQFNNVSFVVVGLGPMGSALTLHLAVVSIPFFYFIVKSVSDIKGIFQTFLFLVITVFSGIAFWLLRIKYLKSVTESFKLEKGIENTIAISKFQFEIYCWFGFLVGGLISLFVFKLLNKKYSGYFN